MRLTNNRKWKTKKRIRNRSKKRTKWKRRRSNKKQKREILQNFKKDQTTGEEKEKDTETCRELKRR